MRARVLVFLVGCAIVPLVSANPPRLSDLPSLGTGDWQTVAFAVSSDGSVVAGVSENSDGMFEAVRWLPDGTVQGLGTANSGSDSFASEVSDDGTVVAGYDFISSTGPGRGAWAFRWSESEGKTVLGMGYPRAMSADGRIIVGVTGPNGFRWTASEGMVLLGAGVIPMATNADGSLVVGRDLGCNCAFRWTVADGVVPIPGTAGGTATATSPFGDVVWGALTGARGFLWTAADGLTSIPIAVESVSHNGMVVLGTVLDESRSCAGPGVWTDSGGEYTIAHLLVSGGIFEVRQWQFFTPPRGLSGDGRFIVGDGWTPRGDTAYIVELEGTVPRNPTVDVCPSDWDHSGSLDSQDYFEFLESFFQGFANFDLCGGTDSQDYFEFLEVFFSGCP